MTGQYTDKITITVLWVDLTSKSAVSDILSPAPGNDSTFDGTLKTIDVPEQSIVNGRASIIYVGTEGLGLRRSNTKIPGLFPYKFLEKVTNATTGNVVWKRVQSNAAIEFLGKVSPANLSFPDKITRDFSKGFSNTKINAASTSSNEFGFVFKRKADSAGYIYGLFEADKITPRIIKKEFSQDDSLRFTQDILPSTIGNDLIISDYDAPGHHVSIGLYGESFYHVYINFPRDYVVFNYVKNVPEISSVNVKWATRADFGINYDDELTYLLAEPNPSVGTARNYVKKVDSLPSLDLTLPISTVTSANLINNNNELLTTFQIKKGTDTKIQFAGTSLLGLPLLVSLTANVEIDGKQTRVKEEHSSDFFPWSEAKEARSFFITNHLPVGAKFKFVLRTINGDIANSSNVVFEIVN